jgi:hypothetical protein
MTIVNVRGTNGSGKSTAVRGVMDSLYDVHSLFIEPDHNHPLGYTGFFGSNESSITWPKGTSVGVTEQGYSCLSIIGPYKTACGGCDAIKTQAEVKHLIEYQTFVAQTNILFEGVLISTIFGPWLEFSQMMRAHDVQFVWAFLDTPLEVCFERIRKRQEASARGVREIRKDQVQGKWEGQLRIRDKAQAAGETVVILSHSGDPARQIRELFTGAAKLQ